MTTLLKGEWFSYSITYRSFEEKEKKNNITNGNRQLAAYFGMSIKIILLFKFRPQYIANIFFFCNLSAVLAL